MGSNHAVLEERLRCALGLLEREYRPMPVDHECPSRDEGDNKETYATQFRLLSFATWLKNPLNPADLLRHAYEIFCGGMRRQL